MKFDRYMLQHGAARHVKFRRLSTGERHAFFLGVLSLASQSPVRGCLMIGSLPVEPADVAAEADVSEKVAESAMRKLRDIGVLDRDEDGFEWVHDFQDYNPEPKADRTGADRQARYRERQRASRNGVTSRVTNAPEVEGEVEEKTAPPQPPEQARGEQGQQGQATPLRANPRALGTNPRAAGRAALVAQAAEASQAAIAALAEVTPGAVANWEALKPYLLRAVDGRALLEAHVEDLRLVATDNGTGALVIDGPEEAWAWASGRFSKPVAEWSRHLGFRARVATAPEHSGLGQVAA